MRSAIIVLFVALVGAGCGDEDPDQSDLSGIPDCPGNVDVNPPDQVRCSTVNDHSCVNHIGTSTEVCDCTCRGYWECDQVLTICGDMAGPRDMRPPQD